MEERHSVRAYESFQMPEEDLNAILTAAGTAPSSWNLQHWKFMVIQDPALKQELLPIANNQQQVVDSSVTIAVLGDLEANLNAPLIYDAAVKAGAMTQEVRDIMISQIEGAYQNAQIARDEAIRNASLAAMQLMLAAKSLGYDSVPMGGFNAQKFIEQFNVPARYIPVLLISIGKAKKPAHESGRFPLSQIVVKGKF
nr:nitroreductase family protein [Paenibacillus sediminis]